MWRSGAPLRRVAWDARFRRRLYIRADMRSCATVLDSCSSDSTYMTSYTLDPIPFIRLPVWDLT